MKDNFVKFPSTLHLLLLPGITVRGDKTLSETERTEFLQHKIIIEEKVDGANLGISFSPEGTIRFQNRGSYLQPPYSGQWKKLEEWFNPHTEQFFENLLDRYILFGEWCYAQHSVSYNLLPDWFLGFDIFDKKENRFYSVNRRNSLFKKIDIQKVPEIKQGHFSVLDIQDLISQSRLSNQPAEGLYLRIDQDDWLINRAKLVRPAFIQTIERHWSTATIKPNELHLNVHG